MTQEILVCEQSTEYADCFHPTKIVRGWRAALKLARSIRARGLQVAFI
jgi:deoxyribodipyrimidine photolyase-like uncharacterized protein